MNDFKAFWADVGPQVHDQVEKVGQSGWLILGQEVKDFERALADFWGKSEAVGVANGLDAIEIGLRALGLKPREKVITTPLSAFATTLAIVRAGGVPVFLDVDEWGNIDLELVAAYLAREKSTRFLLPVHLYGNCVDLQKLAELKERHQLLIVEDAAQAVDASFGGARVGSVGQLTATSFYPTKNLGALGDGGALLTSNASLNAKARVLRDYGQSAKYLHTELGLNSRLDELHAAVLGNVFLPKLAAWTQARRRIAGLYLNNIRNPALKLFRPAPASDPLNCGHEAGGRELYSVRANGPAVAGSFLTIASSSFGVK